MDKYEEKLREFLKINNINCEHILYNESCHSVKEAALAAKTSEDNFIKSICLIDSNENLVVAIVKGEDRVSTTKVGEVLNIEKPKTATVDVIISKTGYPCGGTPPFGYSANFLIDKKVMEKEEVFGGGGSEKSLIKISPKEIQKVNSGFICSIRK